MDKQVFHFGFASAKTIGAAQMSASAKQKRGLNWSKQEMIVLLEAWCDVVKGSKVKGEKAAHTDSRIYQRFAVLQGGVSARTEKAMKDKRKTLPAAYKFISDFNNNMKRGSTGRPNWFDLSDDEQKEIKQANNMIGRVTDIDRDIFAAVSRVLGSNDSVNPTVLVSTTPVVEADRQAAEQPVYVRVFSQHKSTKPSSRTTTTSFCEPMLPAGLRALSDDANEADSECGEVSVQIQSANGVRKKTKAGQSALDVVDMMEQHRFDLMGALSKIREERKRERQELKTDREQKQLQKEQR